MFFIFSLDGNWTKIEEATEIIQYHLNLINLICTCQKISTNIIYINYFDITNPQFGIDEQQIDDLINNQFSLATINFNQEIILKFFKEWNNLEEIIFKQDNYKKDICLYKENNNNIIYLFGLTKLVKKYHQDFEQIKIKFIPQICQINLSKKQV